MKLPSFLKKIAISHKYSLNTRRSIIASSGIILHRSKQAIFALHRGDIDAAEKCLDEASLLLEETRKYFKKFPFLEFEGSYKAALEENVEASLFHQYIIKGKFEKLDDELCKPSVFLGGLSDTTGEILRFAIRSAGSGEYEEVKKARDSVEAIVSYLLDLDLTGYLRQKFDQAKKNLRSLEQMYYEVSLNKRNQ
jgi:translin